MGTKYPFPLIRVIRGKGDFVYGLHKSLHGLKQASRAWNQKIDIFIRSIGFTRSGLDSNLYLSVVEGKEVFIVVFVDEILLASQHMEILEQIAKKIGSEFGICIKDTEKFLAVMVVL